MTDEADTPRRDVDLREPALKVRMRVIGALILYNMQTRFQPSYFGYVFAMAIPLFYLAFFVALRTQLRGAVPIVGDSVLLWFGTGLVPFIMYVYPARGMLQSIRTSRPLFKFPIVGLFDAIAARFILEALTAIATVFFLVVLAILVSLEMRPEDTGEIVSGMLAALALGLAFGTCNAVIAAVYPVWGRIVVFIMMFMWLTSGALIPVSSFPHQYLTYFIWNPLLHIIEWVRDGYYVEYSSQIINKSYPLVVSLTLLGLGLLGERFVRGRITES